MSLADEMAADANISTTATSSGTTNLSKRLSLAEQMQADSSDDKTPSEPSSSTAAKIAYSAFKPIADRIGAFGSGANSGLAATAGLPVDTAANVLDLGKAAIGSIYGSISGKSPPSIFDPMDRTKVLGTSEWIKNKIEQTDAGKNLFTDNADAHPYLHAAGRGVGMAVAGGSPASSLPMVAGASAGSEYITAKTGSPMMGQLSALALPMGAQALKQNRINNAAELAKTPLTVTEQTLQDAQALGFKAPPSQSDGSLLSKISEGLAGKSKVAQTASNSNQAIVNKIAAKDLGLSDNTQITPALLKKIRSDEGVHYENAKQAGPMQTDNQFKLDLKELSKQTNEVQQSFPDAKLPGVKDVQDLVTGLNVNSFTSYAAVEHVKQLRADSRLNIGVQDPATKNLGMAQKQAADALDGVITRNLAKQDRVELANNYISARTRIAKTHTYEDALNEGTGNISLKKVSGNEALTGDIKTASKFYDAYPKANQNPSAVGGTPFVSPLDLYGSIAAAGAGGATLGPAGLALGLGVPLSRLAALKAALPTKTAPNVPKSYPLSSLIAPTLATSDANRNRK